MGNKLFSVVVPTKNREKYLIALTELFLSFKNDDMELVIQDNSDSNDAIKDFLARNAADNIIYRYNPEQLTVVENSDLAVLASSGKYVCFLGDDDLLSPFSYDFVKSMDEHEVDSAIFNVAKYYWPGTEFAAHSFPNLLVYKFQPSIKMINVDDEFSHLLKVGAHTLRNMPKVYHGVVARKVLDKIYKKTGTYFPGPSPDMANSVALAQFVKKHVYCDVPVISSGTSPKSTAGLGAKHKHEGNLKDIEFLPKDIEEKWEKDVPKVWTGPTIYAQSALEALKKLGASELIGKYNFNYMYAAFFSFCPEYRELFRKEKRKYSKYSQYEFTKCMIDIFIIRAKRYLRNIMLSKLGRGAKSFRNITDTVEAEAIIDKEIENIDYDILFTKAGL